MNRTRVWLFLSSCLILALVIGWLLLVIHFQPAPLQPMLNRVLRFLGLMAGGGMALFCLKGPIFHRDGGLRKRSISVVLAIVLCTVQAAMIFTIFFWHYIGFIQDTRLKANAIFETARSELAAPAPQIANVPAGDRFSALHVISAADGRVLSSTDGGAAGSVLKPDPLASYRFPYENVELVAEVSAARRRDEAFSLLLQLFTVAAGSMIMTGEMVLLCIGLIERRRRAAMPDGGLASSRFAAPDTIMIPWLRPLSFLLCFAVRLCSSFIPVMAGELPGTIPGIDRQTAVGLPQSAELFMTCVAVVFTPRLLRRLGWKPPFCASLFVIAAGTLICASAENIGVFILGRAVVGLGYGFCWMTLRNICMMTRDAQAGNAGLVMLIVGIYAGVTCGTALGSLLAELAGFRTVLVISAAASLLLGVAAMPMHNVVPPPPAPIPRRVVRKTGRGAEWGGAAGFLLLLVVPACIAISFTGTYVPLYFADIGRSIGDTGSCQLLYGLTIIYGAPLLDRLAGRFTAFQCSIAGNLILVAVFMLFGVHSGFGAALAVAIFLGIIEIVGSGSQNFFILSFPVFSKLDRMTTFTIISLFKKFAECLGPAAFAFIAGYGAGGVAILGKVFLAGVVLFVSGMAIGKIRNMIAG